jgi:hypothetical protein
LPRLFIPKIDLPRPVLPSVKLPGQVKKEAKAAELKARARAELDALKSEFQIRADAENKRVKDVTDSEFWFCVCFHNREQKQAFLDLTGWGRLGNKYINGIVAASLLGYDFKDRTDTCVRRTRGLSPRLAEFTPSGRTGRVPGEPEETEG